MLKKSFLMTSVLAFCCSTMSARADTVVVNSAGSTYSPDTWFVNNVRNGGTAAITTAHGDNGNGSIQFTAPTAGNVKADMEIYFSAPNSFLLSDLTAFSYDVYRGSSSTASARYEAALRLYVTDGTHSGYLVYEGTYNNQAPVVDAFTSVNALPAYLWATGTTIDGAFSNYNRTAADWAALYPMMRVYGISTGVGSGWDGSFDGAVDNITIGSRSGGTKTYNFEAAASTAVTPEPSSLIMLGTGVLGGVGAARRRLFA